MIRAQPLAHEVHIGRSCRMAKARDFGFALAIAWTLGASGAANGQRFPSILPRGSETIRFDPDRVIARPSLSVRSFILSGLEIPAGGRQLSVRCSLGRELGGVAMCDVPGPQRDIEQAAAELAEHYRFRLDERAQDSASLLVVVIPERILPSDIRTATRVAPVVPFSEVVFERRASGDELGEIFPGTFGRPGLTATVRVDCEILPDLNLFCVDPEVPGLDPDDPGFRPYQLAGLQATGFFRAAPSLASGRPSPGHRFRMTFRFQPPLRDDE